MLYYKATAGCGVGGFVGVSVRKRTAPVALILGRAAVLPPPLATLPSPSPPVARSLVSSVCLAPSSLPRSSSSTYHTRTPFALRDPRAHVLKRTARPWAESICGPIRASAAPARSHRCGASNGLPGLLSRCTRSAPGLSATGRRCNGAARARHHTTTGARTASSTSTTEVRAARARAVPECWARTVASVAAAPIRLCAVTPIPARCTCRVARTHCTRPGPE